MLRKLSVLCGIFVILFGGLWLFWDYYNAAQLSSRTNELVDTNSISSVDSGSPLQTAIVAETNPIDDLVPNADLELFRGLRKSDLLRKLIETDNFTPDIFLALVDANIIDVNEQLRDDPPRGADTSLNSSAHYTPLFAALVTRQATPEQVQAFFDHGAYVDPQHLGWKYAIASANTATAEILIKQARYNNEATQQITELAYYFNNFELFNQLATQHPLPSQQLDSLIDATAARVATMQTTGSSGNSLGQRVQQLLALPYVNAAQKLRLQELMDKLDRMKE